MDDPWSHRRLCAALPAVATGQPVPTVVDFVDHLHRRFAADRELRQLFGGGLVSRRGAHLAFFEQWFAGSESYSESATTTLRAVHADVAITPRMAESWLDAFAAALTAADVAPRQQQALTSAARQFAHDLENLPLDADVDLSRPFNGSRLRRSTEVADCGPGARTLKAALTLARRGQVRELSTLTATHPDLLNEARFAALLVQSAVVADQIEAVSWLLDQTAVLNRPAPLPTTLSGRALEGVCWVTPLAAARWQQHTGVEEVLLDRGGVSDLFESALVGDLAAIDAALSAEASLSQGADPATDAVTITPVHHALAGGQLDAAAHLLRGASSVRSGSRALRIAAEQVDLAAVDLLLRHGADASRVGPGRWVLHPQLAQRLTAAGASAGMNTAGQPSADWIGLSCTGNQRRRDDPDFVAALLDHGASIEDRYRGMSAVEVAARAGFERTVALLRARASRRS